MKKIMGGKDDIHSNINNYKKFQDFYKENHKSLWQDEV